MEEDSDEKCFTFVGLMENEFTSVKVKKEETDAFNLLKEGDLQTVIDIKKEKTENEESSYEVNEPLI